MDDSHERSKDWTYPADFRFIFRMPWDFPKLLLSVSELALAPVSARSLLLPTTTEFRFVETQLPVVRTGTIATWGVLGNSGGRGSQPAVGSRGATVCARVGLELPSHQLRGSEIVRRIGIRLVELVGEHRQCRSTKSWRIHLLRELLEVVGKKLQRGGLTERSGIGSRVLMGRAEGLSLNSGNSRILWDDHIVQLLSVPTGESWNGVWEVRGAGHEILKLLIETARGLGLAKLRIGWHIVHAGLNEVPGELPLGSVIIDLELLLIAARKRGEGGLVAIRPILAMG